MLATFCLPVCCLKTKKLDYTSYNFAGGFVWVWSLVSDIKGGTNYILICTQIKSRNPISFPTSTSKCPNTSSLAILKRDLAIEIAHETDFLTATDAFLFIPYKFSKRCLYRLLRNFYQLSILLWWKILTQNTETYFCSMFIQFFQLFNLVLHLPFNGTFPPFSLLNLTPYICSLNRSWPWRILASEK
jgi:hypothetical protein